MKHLMPLAALLLPAAAAWAHEDAPAPAREGGVVVVVGQQPTSLPTQIPTTVEGLTREQIDETVNATDAEDALKYLPSLLVRKRYPGDYNHAVLSTRASGSGNSARSLVYADGILLSNLLGNGAAFTPRWGLVGAEEIERVDVLYGPFSAAYPGNSVGAVVDYTTRLPREFEAHARIGAFTQPFDLYASRGRFDGRQAQVSLGDRAGPLAWWLSLGRLDSESQPQTFTARPAGTGMPPPGAVAAEDRNGRPIWVTGSGTAYETVQDQARLKLALDLPANLRATLLLAGWRNDAQSFGESYADGQRFLATDEALRHAMAAFTLKRHSHATFDWELSASRYRYLTDRVRAPLALPADAAAEGRLTDMRGTGWTTLAARGVWRPAGRGGAHVLDFGAQHDAFRLRSRGASLAGWLTGEEGAPASRFEGRTLLDSLWLQDRWQFAEGWKSVLGLRAERWRADEGLTQSDCCSLQHPARQRTAWSPKLALARELGETTVLKLSAGRAWRFPTVSELYQGGFNARGEAVNNNPDLRPERSWTGEASLEWAFERSTLRATLFHETTRDALYAQLNPATNANTVQNIERIRTTGAEVAGQWRDLLWRGVDLTGSATYADSRIAANNGFVAVPGDTLDKWQPRVPRWRATVLATWRATERFSASFGARYAGRQYNTLDNSDLNGFAYQGVSRYLTADLRLRWRLLPRWTLAVGVDNLNNDRYWNFHPYPQRTYHAELAFDSQASGD